MVDIEFGAYVITLRVRHGDNTKMVEAEFHSWSLWEFL